MANIYFRWGYADPGEANGVPTKMHWNHGIVKLQTSVIDLHLAFIKLVQDQSHVDDVRVRLHFKLGKIAILYPKTFVKPRKLDKGRYIECSPEWITCPVDSLLHNDHSTLSVIVATKLGKNPWSWEEKFCNESLPQLGVIVDVKDKEGNWYEGFAARVRKRSCRIHFIGWTNTYEEVIQLSKLKSHICKRGTHTKGFYISLGIPKSRLFLYPPYPKPVVSKNKNIKLQTHFQIIGTILNDLPTLVLKENKAKCDLQDSLIGDYFLRDVSFELKGGVTVEAHKTVLAVRSPVFRKMFASNMREKRSGKVQLLDVDPEVMKIFVNSLYDIEFPRNMTPDVWEAVIWLSHKYQVDFNIPNLIPKIKTMLPSKVFPRLFDIFRKIPKLQCYFEHHKRGFLDGVLKIPPKNRTKAMQDFLLGAHVA